jgi:hypothetical protein
MHIIPLVRTAGWCVQYLLQLCCNIHSFTEKTKIYKRHIVLEQENMHQTLNLLIQMCNRRFGACFTLFWHTNQYPMHVPSASSNNVQIGLVLRGAEHVLSTRRHIVTVIYKREQTLLATEIQHRRANCICYSMILKWTKMYAGTTLLFLATEYNTEEPTAFYSRVINQDYYFFNIFMTYSPIHRKYP